MSARMDGLPQLRATLEKVARAEVAKAKREIKRSALNVQNGAKRRVPVDEGRLRNAITHEITGAGLDAKIGTRVKYAASIEFGRAPGSAMPPEGSLLGWMKRHGIDPSLEFVIRRSIGENGTPPRPFLFPALEQERSALLMRLRKLEFKG